MTASKLPTSSILVLTLALAAGRAAADGFIVIEPPRPGMRLVPLAIKHHHVDVSIDGQAAATSVDQIFYNPNDLQLEGTYIFPIPEGAAIDNLSLWIDGVEQKAELLEAEKARTIYEDIVRRMRDPALLEYVGRRAFKLRVFPIPARGERRIKLSYRELVPADGDLARYVYPLNTEKFSSAPIESVRVDVQIASQRPLGNVFALSHACEIKRPDDKHARVTYEVRQAVPDRDFVVHYSATTKDIGLDVVTHRPAGEDGYALVALSPRRDLDPSSIQPKDVVLVFDTSGSMRGARFQQAIDALEFCVETLRAGDRFEIIPFSTEARSLFGALTEVSDDSRARARELIAKLEPVGGTNIDEALERAQTLNPRGDRPFMVVFLTDGQPTIGASTDVGEILKRAGGRTASNQRIFVFGVGNDVNTDLLDRLAGENRGARDYVAENENIEVKVSNLWQKIAHPVLTDLSLGTAGGGAFAEIYPRRLPDLFAGSQILVTTRYTGSGPTAIRLSGKIGAETKEYVYECTLPAEEKNNDYLPRLWAVRKVGYLLDEIRLHGESAELRDEVVRLSRKHGIMTPYTSFLVLEDEARVPGDRPMGLEPGRGSDARGERDALQRRLRAQDGFAPAEGADDKGGLGGVFQRSAERAARKENWAGGGGAGEPGSTPPTGAPSPAAPQADLEEELSGLDAAAASKALKDDAGELAVKASRLIERLKNTAEASDQASTFTGNFSGAIRHVGARTFYRQGQGWVQAEVYDQPANAEIIRVEPYSDAYFTLAARDPEMAAILALGTVCFIDQGKVYLISVS